jgi:segregation and condensation protein A
MTAMGEIRVKTAVFEGPIDLLLTLATKREIDLNQVALAELTSDYIRAVAADREAHSPEEMAAFLVVGSRLLALKASALIPEPEVETEEDLAAWEEAMRGRMQEYSRFKAAALELMQRHQEGGFAFTSAIEAEVIPAVKLEIDRDGLAAAFQDVLDRLPPPTEVAVELHRYSLADEADAIRHRLADGQPVGFSAIFDAAKSRLQAVVIFLALLELVRTGEVKLRQRGTFADIELHPGRLLAESPP